MAAQLPIPYTRRQRPGFSLIELLVVVSLVGILVAISANSIGQQIARDRVIRSANVAQGMLSEASALAVRQRVPVDVQLSGTALQIVERSTGTVLKQRNFGPTFDLRANISINPAGGITIFPNGRSDAGIRITLSGAGATTVVSRTATGIVRRQ
ncbi:MAG: prepilin-type N-terminal cleavage/methylation domain-containing protein [Gemmatimonadaceae bacterium]